ncbi:methyl-accepting chemotaxis protein [Vibrio sp. RC27]
MNTFKVKIATTIGSIIAAIVVVLMTIGYISFQNESVHLNKTVLVEKNATIESELTQKVNGYKSVLAAVEANSSDISESGLSDKAKIQLEMVYRTQSQFIEGAYLIDVAGGIYNVKGEKLGFNVKELSRNYYNAVFRDGKTFFFSDPFVSAVTKKEIVVMAYKLDSSVAVITSVYLDSLLESLGERKDIFMYTENGTIIVAPYAELVGKDINAERPLYKGFSDSNPELHYTADVRGTATDFTAFWTHLDVAGWQFVSFVNDDEIGEAAHNQLVTSALVGAFCLLLAIGILFITLEKMVLKPVGGTPDDIAELMEKMASGDFTQALESTDKDSGIYRSLVKLSGELTQLIKNSHGISSSVAAASTELNVVMNTTKGNAQQELAHMEQISTAINELSSTSQEVSDKAIRAEQEAKSATKSVDEGKQTLEKNICLTDNINVSVSESADIVNELREFALEIGSVTEVIQTISEQTNLLALNAAIEAARAGEQGRGFAVVADEVRNLASKTQKSTVDIQDIIEKLQTQSKKAQDNMMHNVDLIDQSVQLVDNVKASFEDIQSAVESISEINSLVATSSQEQFHVTEEISQVTTETYDLVHQNVSGIDDTLQASSELSELAETQKRELDVFKTA